MGTFCSDLHYLNNSRFLLKERFGKAKIGIGGIDIKLNLWLRDLAFVLVQSQVYPPKVHKVFHNSQL